MGTAAAGIRVLAVMEAYSVTGPAKNLIGLAQRARARGVEISIATFQRGPDTGPNQFITAARAAGLGVDVLRERRALDRSVIPQLHALVEERRPHILQTHNTKSHFLVRWTGLYRRCPWIAFHHGYTATDLKDRVYNQVNRWALRGAQRVVTVCQSFAKDLERGGVGSGRISIVHNTVEAFAPAPAARVLELRGRLGIGEGERVILCAGRLSREKAHRDLVEAAAVLPAGVRIVIAGGGPERGRIEEQCRRLGVADRVLVAGHQPDLAPFYSMAEIAVLPSHSEGSPNVLLEAMAAGVPVVATAVGGVPEIVADGESALLVDKGNPAALAAALGRLLEDRELGGRLAAAARQRALHYRPELYCERLVPIYEQMLEAGVPAQVSR